MTESWQARLQRQAQEAHEMALARPRPWVVTIDGLCNGLFASGPEEEVAVAATLIGMGEPCRAMETSSADVSWFPVGGRERLVSDESNMRGLMRAVRRSALHGSYRKSGTDKVYKF